MHRLVVFVSVLALIGVGCSSTLKTRRLPVGSLDGIGGLAVTHPVPQGIVVIFPAEPGSKKALVVRESQALLPSPNEIYEINYRGALFASRNLEVDLHADGSVKRVKVASTNQTPEALAELTKAAKSAGEVQKALEGPAPAPAPDPVDVQNAALEKQLRSLMLQANLQAVQSGAPPPYPGVGTPE